MSIEVGSILTFERKFTKEDVDVFTDVSKDEGAHHIHADAQGRFVVQGLLTATLPTKIGGDYNIMARTMNFEFLRPVYTGDVIVCDVTIEKFEPEKKNRTAIAANFLCTNQEGHPVMLGNFAGVIF